MWAFNDVIFIESHAKKNYLLVVTMTHSIKLNSVSVEFPIYGASSKSFKKQLIRLSTGGLLKSNDHHIVTINALSDITLKIEQGDRVGLIGHNGAGKSTLLRVLAQIYEPTQGTMTINGHVTALLDVMLGMDPESTGYENIFLRGILQGLTRKEIKLKAQSIADFTELGDYLTMPVRTYSSGMSLRLAFAITTTLAPEILVLDEVVGVGDAAFIHKAQQRFDELISEAKIVILASHDLIILEKICNKIVWLDAGRIKFFGELSEGLEQYKKHQAFL